MGSTVPEVFYTLKKPVVDVASNTPRVLCISRSRSLGQGSPKGTRFYKLVPDDGGRKVPDPQLLFHTPC